MLITDPSYRVVHTDDESYDIPLAYCHKASQESVDTVLNAPLETGDGRSDWYWLRLPNGDLMLGVFPQGETYFDVEIDAEYREDKNN